MSANPEDASTKLNMLVLEEGEKGVEGGAEFVPLPSLPPAGLGLALALAAAVFAAVCFARPSDSVRS